MDIGRVAGTFVSGCLVYAVMAACSSGVDTGSDRTSTPTGSSGGTSSGATSSGSPVPNAMADEWWSPGSRLKVRYVETEDGAKQFLGWFDTKRGESCVLYTYPDGSMRCLPTLDAIVGTYFSDPACATPLAHRTKATAAPAPKSAAKFDGSTYRIYPVTGAFDGTAYQSLGSCMAAPPSAASNYSFWAVGPEVAPTEFVAGTVKTAP